MRAQQRCRHYIRTQYLITAGGVQFRLLCCQPEPVVITTYIAKSLHTTNPNTTGGLWHKCRETFVLKPAKSYVWVGLVLMP
jgi:hypothetical protein